MKKEIIITKLKEYYQIHELVCPHTYTRFGERAWEFLDKEFLETLLIIRRDILQIPLTSNNYGFGGSRNQSGLRCNICELVRNKTLANKQYLSSHLFGIALDSVSSKMSAEEMRQKIISNQHLLPYPIRIENDVTWLHFDLVDKGEKVYKFDG